MAALDKDLHLKENESFMAIYKKISSLKNLPSVRQLRAFMAVYETGSVSAAADLLALTQPAVTLLLKELEHKLGVRLFDRSTRTLQRTEAAPEAYAHAERVLGDLTDMATNLSGLATGERGRLQIATTSTLAQTLLPPVIRAYTERWPGVRVGLDDCSPAEFIEVVSSGRATLGVGTLETPLPHVVEQVLSEDPLVAVGLADRFFAHQRPISWKQLGAFPLVAVKPGYGVRRQIDAAALSAGVSLQVVHEVAMLSTALAMTGAGLGVTIVPASVARHTPYSGLRVRRLVAPVVTRRTAVLYTRGRSLSAAAQGFVDLLMTASRNKPT
jgi:LysR family transcriptional regulator, carnitine catabolism transcriptional activator